MALELMKLFQDENEPNTTQGKDEGITIPWLFSGTQSFEERTLPQGQVTTVRQIESGIPKPTQPTVPNLQPHIDEVKAILDKKSCTDFSDDTIAIYLYKKFFIEANDDRKNKKYEDAIKGYKLVLEYVQEIRKDENEAEDIQNIIAICYGQLGLEEDNWKKELKAYEEALKFASESKIIKRLNKNKIAVALHKLKEAETLIIKSLYDEALKICDKILELSLKEGFNDIIKNTSEDFRTWCVVQSALDRANQNPKISSYNKIIAKVEENFKIVKYLEQDGLKYYPGDLIARACNGIIKCHNNQKQYFEAKATYEKGLKFSKSTQTLNDLQKSYLLTLTLSAEDFFKKREFIKSAQEYNEAFKIIESLPDELKEEIQIPIELIECLIQAPNTEQAIKNINNAWEAFIDPQFKFPLGFLDTIRLDKIKLQIEFSDTCLSKKDFKRALKNLKEALDICQDKDARELLQKGIIGAWFLYIDHLEANDQALKEIQKLLNYHFDKNANFKVAKTCLNQVEKILEQAKAEDIINLNITPEAIFLQIDIMHIVAKHLHKIGSPDEAIAKYNQILTLDIIDELKHQVGKEKSNSLIALARQTEESGTLDAIIIAYEAAISSSTNDPLKDSLRKKCFAIIANFKTNAVNSDHGEEFLALCSKAISETTDEKLKSGIKSKIDYELGVATMKQGKLDQAIEFLDQAFSKAITTEDKNSINRDRAEVWRTQMGRYSDPSLSDEAIAILDKIKKLNISVSKAAELELYQTHRNWVVQAKKNGDYREAIEILGQMLRFITDLAKKDNITKQIDKLLCEADQKVINLSQQAEEVVNLYEKAESFYKDHKYQECLELLKQSNILIQELKQTALLCSRIDISFDKSKFPILYANIASFNLNLEEEMMRFHAISKAISIMEKNISRDYDVFSPQNEGDQANQHPEEATSSILGAEGSSLDVEG